MSKISKSTKCQLFCIPQHIHSTCLYICYSLVDILFSTYTKGFYFIELPFPFLCVSFIFAFFFFFSHFVSEAALQIITHSSVHIYPINHSTHSYIKKSFFFPFPFLFVFAFKYNYNNNKQIKRKISYTNNNNNNYKEICPFFLNNCAFN